MSTLLWGALFTGVQAATIACSPGQITVAKVFDCEFTVTITGAPPGAQVLRLTQSEHLVYINDALNPVDMFIISIDDEGNGSAVFRVRAAGDNPGGGIIHVDATFPGTGNIQVNTVPAQTQGEGQITIRPGGQRATTLTLTGTGCALGKKVRATPTGGWPAGLAIATNPVDLTAGQAQFTFTCAAGTPAGEIEVTFAVDPTEARSEAYNYPLTVKIRPEAPACDGQRDVVVKRSRDELVGPGGFGRPSSLSRSAARFDGGSSPYGLSADCLLVDYNLCSGWIWTFNDTQGAVWGHVFDPNDCAGGCLNGGVVTEIILYARCNVVPGSVNSIRIDAVDANNCPTASLCATGPLSLTQCVAGNRWTTIAMNPNDCHLSGHPFAVSIEMGVAGDITYATDNGIANMFCATGIVGTFPGCFSTIPSCGGYVVPGTQKSFIFVTDFNGDTTLDDLCTIYGAPYGLAFPYVYGCGYLVNNLLIGVGMDCSSPTNVAPSSWGRVKALFE